MSSSPSKNYCKSIVRVYTFAKKLWNVVNLIVMKYVISENQEAIRGKVIVLFFFHFLTMEFPLKVCSDLVRSFLCSNDWHFLVRALSYKTTLLFIYDGMNTSGIKAELCTSRIKIKSDISYFVALISWTWTNGLKKIMKEIW